MKQYPQQSTAAVEPALDRPKHLSPSQARASLKVELARVSRTARERAGLSQPELAAELEIQRPHLTRCEIAYEGHAPTLLHVASATGSPAARAWARAMLGWLQGIVAPSADQHGANHGARLASVTLESTDVLREFTTALADGQLSSSEIERLEREARESAAAALELADWCAAELRRRRENR